MYNSQLCTFNGILRSDYVITLEELTLFLIGFCMLGAIGLGITLALYIGWRKDEKKQ